MELRISSPVFSEQGWIPDCYSGYGEDISPVNKIPGKLPKGKIIKAPIHLEQGKAYGKHCYRGPKPPFNWKHKYYFTVYTLDVILSLDADADKKKVLEAAGNHILQQGVLIGMYQRKHK